MDLKRKNLIYQHLEVDLDQQQPTNLKKTANLFEEEKPNNEEVPVSRKLNFSGIDFGQINQRPLINVLSEYEEVNEGLQVLFEHYQREHIWLKEECLMLVRENEKLTSDLKKFAEGEIKTQSSSVETNLRQQLSVALQEKDAVLDLWRLAVSEVTNLEKVIKILQEQKDFSFNTSNLEARGEAARRLASLEGELTEARLALAEERGARSVSEMETAREREGRQAAERNLAAAVGAAQTLEGKVSGLAREKEQMQRTLDGLQAQYKEMRMQADEGQIKVSDALALVDSACLNRDSTTLQLAQAKEEIGRLEAALQSLKAEAAAQVKREVEQVKQQCNLHVKSILVDVKKSHEEGTELKNKVEKAIYSQKQAEQVSEEKGRMLENARFKESSLEPKLQAAQAQLRDCESRCAVAEKKALILQQNFNHEQKRWAAGELRVTETCKHMEKQVCSLADELEKCRAREIEMSKKFSLREQQFSWRILETEKSSKVAMKELNTIVLAHQTVSEKSKVEMRQMAEKFSHRLKELRYEVLRLREERDQALQHFHNNSKMNRSINAQITPRPKSLYMDV